MYILVSSSSNSAGITSFITNSSSDIFPVPKVSTNIDNGLATPIA